MLSYQFYVHWRRFIWFFTIIASLFAIFSTQVQAQQAYGDGRYGECAYAQGCETPTVPPSTIVPVPPSPENPQAGRAFSANIVDGQVFREATYGIYVTPNFPSEQIDRVVLLQDGVVVGEAREITGESYHIDWDVPEEGSYAISILVYLKDGEVIRRDFTVSTVGASEEGGETGPMLTEDIPGGDIAAGGSWLSGAVNAVKTFFEKVIAATPTAVAYGIPYLFLSILAGIAGLLLLQTRNQFAHIVALLRLLEKDKLLAEEKTTFIMLVSHHLRTPLTILRNSLDLYASENSADTNVKVAQEGVAALQQKSEAILKSIAENKHLRDIKMPNIVQIRQKLYYSWQVIVPALLSVVVIVILNVMYLTAEKTRLIVPNLLLQAVILAAVIVAGYALFRRYQQRQKEVMHTARQREYEEALDKARNKFILRVVKEITPILVTTKEACEKLTAKEEVSGIKEAFMRLDTMISRFVLAAELERGKIAASASLFDIEPVAEKVVSAAESQQLAKNLTVKTRLQPTMVETNEFLLRYVLTALYDNAIRYADEGTAIKADLSDDAQYRTFVIENQGKGIPEDKLALLFKPFSTSEGVEVFNNTSMGLNLYLSRLIMRYLNGDIRLQSKPGETTTAIVTIGSEAGSS